MQNKQYVIVDIETTWLDRTYDRIIEIAAVRFDGEKIVDERQTLVNPEKQISGFIRNFTWISQDMVVDAPCIQDVLPWFFDFMGDDIFVAHNASFDKWFIAQNALRHHQHDRRHHVVCTRKIANRVVSALPNKKLATLCQHYNIVNTQAHRAMADVLATTQVLRNFIIACERYHTDSSPVWLLDIQKRSVGYGKRVFGE